MSFCSIVGTSLESSLVASMAALSKVSRFSVLKIIGTLNVESIYHQIHPLKYYLTVRLQLSGFEIPARIAQRSRPARHLLSYYLAYLKLSSQDELVEMRCRKKTTVYSMPEERRLEVNC
ncbi:hypothetical protein ALC56_01153 [Trachymyrmex septentrionalis]|uniref:Uncharacterized protein n=1 Tax=Trachymyrmex septentrionalis TaxID=34720 RepID=A0A195FUX7_9HYME|nr:hypothetical protein ALC56_01153 [Trachymyrmex septentrionalis]